MTWITAMNVPRCRTSISNSMPHRGVPPTDTTEALGPPPYCGTERCRHKPDSGGSGLGVVANDLGLERLDSVMSQVVHDPPLVCRGSNRARARFPTMQLDAFQLCNWTPTRGQTRLARFGQRARATFALRKRYD